MLRYRNTYHYAGPLNARREGRVYPFDEVMEALLEEPGPPVTTSMVAVPVGGMSGDYRYLLLVFTGAQPPDSAPSTTDLRRRVELHVGPEFVPDRFEFFPLFPRLKEGRVDMEWCQMQYFTGALHQKKSDPLMQALTALRALVLQAPGATGPAAPEKRK